MKKIYTSLTTFIVLLSLLTVNLSAQLSGVVTINSGAPASSTNYQTFSALASTLNASGLNGPLTVDVVALSGPYIEQPSFGVIAGASATNTITINGNNNVLTFSASVLSAAWTLNLNGTDHMFINDLTVVGTSSTIALACVLNSGADYNTFTSCTFSTPLNATATSNQIPVLITGSNSGNITQGNSANYTTFKGCSMIGGIYNVYVNGNNNPPFATNNTFDGCKFRETYSYGINCQYQVNLIIRGCTVDRLTRTNVYTLNGVWAMYLQYNQNSMIENNIIEKLYDAQQNSTSYAVGIYFGSTSATSGTGIYNTYRNNVIRDIKSNGHTFGIYGGTPDGYIHHNTISLDYTGSVATGSTIGIQVTSGAGFLTDIRNNCVSITRGGTGPKFCFHSNGSTGNITLDYNNYYMNAAAGTSNFVGFYSANAANLTALQAQGVEANGMSTDPLYTLLPNNLIPTSTIMNDKGTPVGTVNDHLGLNRSGVTPDMGAYEYLSVNCTGVPSGPSISLPSQTLCFGTNTKLLLNGTSSDLGITYQWLSSPTSSSGPWTIISGANTAAYTTPATTGTMFYGVETKCILSGATSTAAAAVNLAATTISTVPCYESFEGVTKTNNLPNCSWSASSPGGSCLTYTTVGNGARAPRTGNNFASFFWSPLGDKYFYTNGVQLNAGVTYSAGLWFQTDYNGFNNWADMSILYGTTQSTTGLVPIVSTSGPAVATVYKALSGTFTVPTSGIYYIAIKETNTVQIGGSYLVWDDLSITIPCSLNTPSITVTASADTICAGQLAVLNASGADQYLWNTGASTNSVTQFPTQSTMYSVNGTSTLSGCSSTSSQYIEVNPSPDVFAAGSPSVCAGSSLNLSALGNAISYTWSTGSSNPNISVSPAASTSYTLYGANSFSCISKSVLPVTVVNLPTVNAASSASTGICAGETLTLAATGGASYVWKTNPSGLVLSGATIHVNPSTTTIYTLTGTDAAGCSDEFTLTQTVSECLGLNQTGASLSGVRVYPNPTNGVLIVELMNSSLKTVEVTDVTGRIISTNSSTAEIMNINLTELSNGIYYVKIKSESAIKVMKVVKQ